MGDPRVGLGFDVHPELHPKEASRPLMLGGVAFPGEAGLAGHSDGDVVCHAIADALLGAASLGDLGEHFPDTDSSISGIAGLDLLGKVVELLRGAGARPASCDASVIADRPAIAPRREEMQVGLAAVLDVPVERVSIKATRPEGLGLSGDGAACLAIVVLSER